MINVSVDMDTRQLSSSSLPSLVLALHLLAWFLIRGLSCHHERFLMQRLTLLLLQGKGQEEGTIRNTQRQ